MYINGIRRKSDGEWLGGVMSGDTFKLPPGIAFEEIEFIPIYVPECGDHRMAKTSSEPITKMARHLGMGISDFIEFAAKTLGIPMCPVCQMTKKILYAIDKIGWMTSIKLIFKTRLGIPYSKKEKLIIETLKEEFDGV